jgi:putative FmdB family regulatory protein
MPIYEYRCENGHQFEAFQSMSEEALDSCEVCDAPASRILHAPAVHFKGSGFYTTDYARKGAKKAGAESGGDAGKADSKDSSTGSEPKSKSKSSESDKKPTASKSD